MSSDGRGVFALATADRALEAKARFNLGICEYGDGAAACCRRRTRRKPRGGVLRSPTIEPLAAIGADGDGRANIELARLLIRQLDQQDEQDQQQHTEHAEICRLAAAEPIPRRFESSISRGERVVVKQRFRW